MSTIRGKAVIGQAGGPTAVINQSAVGILEGLREIPDITQVLGMRHGVAGLVKGDVIDVTHVEQERLDRIARTPSAALGSTRAKPDARDCRKILDACEKENIRYFFYIGGNDSSDTCRIINDLAKQDNYELRCFHVPKTVDNDLVINHHTPGYPSAARFVAMACMADFMDNISLPGIKINVIMGRHSGYLTAAAALARRSDHERSTDGPQLIYVPEIPFDVELFINDVAEQFDRSGRAHIAVSEGISDADGMPIGGKLIEGGQTDAHGNVQLSGSGALGDSLANLLKHALTPTGGKPPRIRADTFGYIQRCWPIPAPLDAKEAREAGHFAARLAAQGDLDGSIAIVNKNGDDNANYETMFKRVELSDIAAKTKHLPTEFIDGHNNISKAFLEYVRPLVGELPTFDRY